MLAPSTVIEIGAVAAEPTLGEEHGEFGSGQRVVLGGGTMHHMCEPGMERQPGQRLAFGGDAARCVERFAGDRARRAALGRKRHEQGVGKPSGATEGCEDQESDSHDEGRERGDHCDRRVPELESQHARRHGGGGVEVDPALGAAGGVWRGQHLRAGGAALAR